MTLLTDKILAQIGVDPTRPSYHFCAPAGWMNDPNGTVFHNGYFHVFYQWNPYSDCWGNIHWGHARSRNLITWEYLPVALKPAPELGEEQCYSGCLVLRGKAPPLILYTAIGPQMDARKGAQQWAALGDDQLIFWQKHPRNPILTAKIHGDLEVLEWRDPFVFVDNGRTFLLLCGKLSEKDGHAAVVLLYEAKSATLDQWAYCGILFRHPDLMRAYVECVNFFKSGQHWVLLLSTYERVEYYIGDFDAETGIFNAHTNGLCDGSDQFYATNILQDDQQRHLCFGWIRGFAPHRGWAGCLSLPRVLSIDQKGGLRQTPASEVNLLHGHSIHAADIPLGTYTLVGFQSDAMDIHAIIRGEPSAKFGVRLIPIYGQTQPIILTCTPNEISLNDKFVPYHRDDEADVDFRLFLDRSVVEVFIDNRASLTFVLYPPASVYRVELFSENSIAKLYELEAWYMTNDAVK